MYILCVSCEYYAYIFLFQCLAYRVEKKTLNWCIETRNASDTTIDVIRVDRSWRWWGCTKINERRHLYRSSFPLVFRAWGGVEIRDGYFALLRSRTTEVSYQRIYKLLFLTRVLLRATPNVLLLFYKVCPKSIRPAFISPRWCYSSASFHILKQSSNADFEMAFSSRFALLWIVLMSSNRFPLSAIFNFGNIQKSQENAVDFFSRQHAIFSELHRNIFCWSSDLLEQICSAQHPHNRKK